METNTKRIKFLKEENNRINKLFEDLTYEVYENDEKIKQLGYQNIDEIIMDINYVNEKIAETKLETLQDIISEYFFLKHEYDKQLKNEK